MRFHYFHILRQRLYPLEKNNLNLFDLVKDCLCLIEAKTTPGATQWSREVLDVMKNNTKDLSASDGTIMQIIRFVRD